MTLALNFQGQNLTWNERDVNQSFMTMTVTCLGGGDFRSRRVVNTSGHYSDVVITMVSQITSLMIVYSTIYLGSDQRKHQSSASLAFVRGIHRSPVNSPHKGPVTRKILPFDDVIMLSLCLQVLVTGPDIGVPVPQHITMLYHQKAHWWLLNMIIDKLVFGKTDDPVSSLLTLWRHSKWPTKFREISRQFECFWHY